ncbi:hypothetical protein [Romboutsia ilealis]|uniref:hypothetical protein n=1 Tax=Romboutsia ilealis TaxID=1115758 RepID=UPI00272A53BB|nr:hypothetical protein [Romboutsia ilealis]
MFKHNADSIKETSSKQFISQLDRQAWDNKSDSVHEHDKDYYKKSEVDDMTERSSLIVEDKIITIQSKKGNVNNIELYGNSIQPNENDYNDIRSVGELLDSGKARLKLTSKNFNLCSEEDIILDSDLGINGEDTISHVRKTTDYIQVKGGSTYLIKFTPDGTDNKAYGQMYDIKKKLIKPIQFEKPSSESNFLTEKIITVPNDVYYIRIRFPKTSTDIMIAEVEDLNHPYVESKTSHYEVILPCQLEGITNVETLNSISDKLFRDVDGRYKIKKKIATYVFTDSDVFSFSSFEDKGQCYKIGICFYHPFASVSGYVVSNKFKSGVTSEKYETTQTQVSICRHVTNTEVCFTFKKSDYPDITDLESARAHMSKLIKEGLYIKYVTATPEILELPLDVNITLDSFDGVTNIFTDSEIPHNIKCEVPTSVSSTSSIIRSELDKQLEIVSDIEGLKDIQILTYGTSNGVVTVENSHNGYIDNIYIQGKTLYNLMNIKNVKTDHHSHINYNTGRIILTAKETGYTNFFTSKKQFKPNTTYTIICNVFKNTLEYDPNKLNGSAPSSYKIFRVADDYYDGIFKVPWNSEEQDAIFGYKEGETGIKKMVITTVDKTDYDNDDMFGIRSWISSNALGGTCIEFSLAIIEGDHLRDDIIDLNPDVINVGMQEQTQLTTTNGNLLPLHEEPDIVNGYNCLTVNDDSSVTFINNTGPDDSNHPIVDARYVLKLKPRTDYVIQVSNIKNTVGYCIITYRLESESKEKYISTCNNTPCKAVFNSNESGELIFRFTSEYQNSLCNSTFKISLNELSSSKLYQNELKSDNKKLQTNDGETLHLRSVDNRTFDTIEKIHGQYKYVKRCEEVRYFGDESWYYVETHDDTIGFGTNLSKKAYNVSLMYVNSNRFPTLNNNKTEGIRIGNWGNAIFIYINKNKLNGETVEDFKSWLRDNNLVVTYRLEIPEYNLYQDLSLKAFEGQTNLSLRMSALSPDVLTFNAPGYIGTTIKTMRDKVRYLENKLQIINQAGLISTLNDINNRYKIEQTNKF